jgi:hypothetical protein
MPVSFFCLLAHMISFIFFTVAKWRVLFAVCDRSFTLKGGCSFFQKEDIAHFVASCNAQFSPPVTRSASSEGH